MKYKDYIGKYVGPFKIIAIDHLDHRQKAVFKCICGVCKQTVVRHSSNLNKVKSCGCAHASSRIKHGQSRTDEYKIWGAMIRRCYSPQSQGYWHYGARGIKVCARWRKSFANFISDVGFRPSPYHSLERINNNSDYKPSNVRWATYKEQNSNRRGNVLLTLKGRTQTLSAWAIELRMSGTTIRNRLRKGMPIAKVLDSTFLRRKLAKKFVDNVQIKPVTLFRSSKGTKPIAVGLTPQNVIDANNLAKYFGVDRSSVISAALDLMARAVKENNVELVVARQRISVAKKVEYAGQTLTLKEWAQKFNISLSTLDGRLRNGMNIHEALTTPVEMKYSTKGNAKNRKTDPK